MKDLLQLDSIVGQPGVRTTRKEQVNSIQQLLNDVDNIKTKLKEIGTAIKTKEEFQQIQENKKEVFEETKSKTKEKGDNKNKQEENKTEMDLAHKRQQIPMQQRWRDLKLSPNFKVQEYPDSYVISGFIPGIQDDDLSITFGKENQTITIKGVRIPTKEEEGQLIQQLRKYQNRGQEKENDLFLRLGSGRFGSFSESYYIPPNTDVKRIAATYEGGAVKVVIPKKQTHRRHNFYNDNDFWW